MIYGLSTVSRSKIIIIICTREANGAAFWSSIPWQERERKSKGKGQPSLARCGEPTLWWWGKSFLGLGCVTPLLAPSGFASCSSRAAHGAKKVSGRIPEKPKERDSHPIPSTHLPHNPGHPSRLACPVAGCQLHISAFLPLPLISSTLFFIVVSSHLRCHHTAICSSCRVVSPGGFSSSLSPLSPSSLARTHSFVRSNCNP